MDSELIKEMVIFIVISLVVSLLLYLATSHWRACRRDKKKAIEMATWPTTQGLAKDWKVISRISGRSYHNAYYFKACINYHYNVDGKAYSTVGEDNKKFFYHLDRNNPDLEERARQEESERKTRKEAEAYAISIVEAGKRTEIYYNPNDPSESVAELPDIDSCVPNLVVVVILSVVLLISASLAIFFIGAHVWVFFREVSGR